MSQYLNQSIINLGATVVGNVASYYNIPIMIWGPVFESDFSDQQEYPSVISGIPNFLMFFFLICIIYLFNLV